jgi:DNA-binding NtrC family response regulator
VSALAEHFLATKAARYKKPISGFSPEAQALLMAHSWPGNVRELEHVVERAVVLAEGSVIEARDLNLQRFAGGSAEIERMTLADAEAYLIRKALARSSGNVLAAAEQLGLSRSALYRRLQALDIRVQE